MSKLIKLINIILIIFIGQSSIAAKESNLPYLIRSMRWKTIGRTYKDKPYRNTLENYALVRYHESSNEGSSEKKALLLYKILTNDSVSKISEYHFNQLLQKSIRFDSIQKKLAFLKFYDVLAQHSFFNSTEKLKYLKKMPREHDPVSIEVFEKILTIHYESKRYDEIIKIMDYMSYKEKQFLKTVYVQRLHASSLARIGKKEESKKIFFAALRTPRITWSQKKTIVRKLKIFMGRYFFLNLSRDRVAEIIHLLSTSDIRKIYSKNIINNKTVFSKARHVKNTAHAFIKAYPGKVTTFLYKNYFKIIKERKFLARVAEKLVNINQIHAGIYVLRTFLNGVNDAKIYKTYARIYKKYNEEEKYFLALVNYLKLYPYNLYYQDKLIDYLTGSGKNIQYATDAFWEEAFQTIPNLPVKGRLVYWYLRYLKYSQNTKRLNEILSQFYKYCPGSYYLQVISEEFSKELSSLQAPSNPFSKKKNLYKYISINYNKNYLNQLVDKDLGFAHYRYAEYMVKRFNYTMQRIEGNSVLNLAVDYIKIGEYRKAMQLIDHYSSENKFSDNERYELLVIMGDLGGNTYFSMYYTRLLMKKYLIPDDTLLLPKSINNRLYPRPHRSLVKIYQDRFSVDEDIIYAVMRQESFFKESAVSSASARGLMQVMPSTGRMLARALKVKRYSLNDPEISIQFGAKFLSDLLGMYKRSLRWSSIAYNGGPGNLRKWKRRYYDGDFNHFLERLPTKETRDYCRIIMSNYRNYKVLTKLKQI